MNRYLAAVSGVLKITVIELGRLSKNPVARVSKFAESKGRERCLSDSERQALLEECNAARLDALLPVVELALATGARKGELLSLQWSGVEL